MQSERKFPLWILGTPLGSWRPLANSILKQTHFQGEDLYENWHQNLFGAGTTELEVGLSRINAQKLEIPAQLNWTVEKLAETSTASSAPAGTSAYGCWTADYWMNSLPSSTCLVFYEHPSRMIARHLAAAPSSSVEALLSIWSAGARAILSAVRRHRERCYLLDVRGCLEHREKYSQWMQKRLGIAPEADDGARELLREDITLHALAEILYSENPSIIQLVQELDASAQPIGDETDFSNPGELAKSTAAALNEVLVLRQNGAELEKRGRLLVAKEIESHTQTERISELENELERRQELAWLKEKETLANHERLLTELHQAFQESEGFFEKWKRAETSGRESYLTVGSVARVDSNEESDLRHINYTFHDVELFGRHWLTLNVRLVQHHGRAGIGIFASKNSTNLPLYNWEPSGSEDGRPFMLFVPTDVPARDALVRATASNLALITDSVSLIRSDLRVHGLPENCRTRWINVADRLLEEINDLPERLHYDSVKTYLNPAAEGAPGFSFDVIHASFRGRIFPSLKLSWSPSLIGGQLSIHLPDGERPAFSYWPQAADGKFVEALEYSTWGPFTGKGRDFLKKFTRKDKAFLQTILSEIPNFLVHASEQHPRKQS